MTVALLSSFSERWIGGHEALFDSATTVRSVSIGSEPDVFGLQAGSFFYYQTRHVEMVSSCELNSKHCVHLPK
jgi:hypothetical protein